VVRFTKLIFTAAGFLEPFGGGAIGLDFGHRVLLLFRCFRVRPAHHHRFVSICRLAK
jgi:hypothetical protein